MPIGPLAAAILVLLAVPCRAGSDSPTAYDHVRARSDKAHSDLNAASLTDQQKIQAQHQAALNQPLTGGFAAPTPESLEQLGPAAKMILAQPPMVPRGEQLTSALDKARLANGQIDMRLLGTMLQPFQTWDPMTNSFTLSPDGKLFVHEIGNTLGLPLFAPKTPTAAAPIAPSLSAAAPVTTPVQPAAPAVTFFEALRTTLKSDPTGPTGLGDLYAKSGQPAKGVEFYTEALARGAGADVRYKRGLSAEKAGDPELANSDARQVLEGDPRNVPAHSLFMLTRGRTSNVRLLEGQGASASSPDGGRRGAGTDGSGAAGDDGSSGADDGGDVRLTAEEIAQQENAALTARPVSAQSAKLTREAKGALRVRDTKTALRLTEEALQADPGNSDAHYVRATAFLQMRDPGRAAAEASAGLELASGNAPLLYTRAVANGRQKLWREAYADAEDAVRNAPTAGYAYQVRAAANWALGRKAEMNQDLRTSARLDRAYAAALQRASQQPSDVDPTLLFGDEPQAAAPAAPPSGSRPPYFFWAVGSLLAVIGIAPFLVPDLRGKVTTVFRRGPSAAAEDGDAPAGLEVPLAGFWKRYDVTREIGAGGMGVVYEAWDRQLERRVAVKRMRDEIRNDRRERERFLQEARMVARLRHPNLVEIYSIEEDGPDAYLVFEFVEGLNLHQMLGDKGRFSPAEAREVFRGLCAGVEYAHRQGVVHRDLKPANVIVEPDGTVKVMDFGVARQAQDAMMRRQMTNTIIGTPQYMAPEQEEGVVCTQSDVYALGVCLYEMLAGTPPFSGSAGSVTLAKREARYEPLTRRVAELPPALGQVVDRALDPKPETRTQSAAALMSALDAALSNVTA